MEALARGVEHDAIEGGEEAAARVAAALQVNVQGRWCFDHQLRNSVHTQRNRRDLLLDWLDEYGARFGFRRDSEQDRYDPALEFTAFISQQRKRFQTGIVLLLGGRVLQLFPHWFDPVPDGTGGTRGTGGTDGTRSTRGTITPEQARAAVVARVVTRGLLREQARTARPAIIVDARPPLSSSSSSFQQNQGRDDASDEAVVAAVRARCAEMRAQAPLGMWRSPVAEICASQRLEAHRLDRFQQTRAAMQHGAPIIVGAALHDHQNYVVCCPHLLIRSDMLPALFPPVPPDPPVVSGDTRDSQASGSAGGDGSGVAAAAGGLYAAHANRGAPGIGQANFHYVVVLVRFGVLKYTKDGGELQRTRDNDWYRYLAVLQTRALAEVQGYWPHDAFLVGRGWVCDGERGSNALETFARLPGGGAADGQAALIRCNRALRWLQRLRRDGAQWRVLPRPSHPFLYPNMKLNESFPWAHEKKRIAEELKEITMLWFVTVMHRRQAHRRGVFRYDDPRMCLETLGFSGKKRGAVLANLIAVNQRCLPAILLGVSAASSPLPPTSVHHPLSLSASSSSSSLPSASSSPSSLPSASSSPFSLPSASSSPFSLPSASVSALPLARTGHRVLPPPAAAWLRQEEAKAKVVAPAPVAPLRIKTNRFQWRDELPIEFFADMETTSSINDDLSALPRQQDTTSIGMIGCGYWTRHPRTHKKDLECEQFVCKRLRPADEAQIITEWLAYMEDALRAHGAPKGTKPRVWHWSHAEPTFLRQAWNSAAHRHGRDDWKTAVEWCDLLTVVREAPLVVHGSLGFGLKSIVKALHKLHKVDQIWPEDQIDSGLAAMVALFRCEEHARLADAAAAAAPGRDQGQGQGRDQGQGRQGRQGRQDPGAMQRAGGRPAQLSDSPYMRRLQDYLNVDVRGLASVLVYLRKYH